MRPTGSPQVLEARRKIAARLFEQGMSLSDVAAAVGASVSSAHRWRKAWKHGGKLRPKPHPGPRSRLSPTDKRRLVCALLKGPHVWGYAPSGWTGPLVRDLIHRLFGVDYHAHYVPRLLRKLGWSPQQPEQRARERDESEITRWRRDDWPRIKKEPRSAS
jgi:transposase